MRHLITFFITTILLSSILTYSASADSNCPNIYGGGDTCSASGITMDKQILNPATNDYVDHLGNNDPSYQPSSPIFFKIIIHNLLNTTIPSIVVKDTIDSNHEFLEFTNGPGNYDPNTKTLTYTINNLQAGQDSIVIISGRVLSSQYLPSSQPLICAGNTVMATPVNKVTTQATTQYCIRNNQEITQTMTKGGLPLATPTPLPTQQPIVRNTPAPAFPVYTGSPNLKKSPSTGPETLPLLALIPTGGLGLWLRRKAK